ncbi:hypothetical protein IQ268_24510 [Oculatella sp. LEGE 06141]|uniref:hypothetical protein n=1 Tax=Oculatella sp. LEGE 06141 TaxID=1828648 RepID=UPI00188043DB|nr:hypothetical protein [Oculatella sp. LEGE 06141]
MRILQSFRTALVALSLVLVLVTTSACSGVDQATQSVTTPTTSYSQLERGNTTSGQSFGNWVVQTAHGLIQDAYVRDSDKLGVVISPQVRPNEVRALAKSLVQGFQKNFPNHDLTVLMYAPDKELILTAKYDNSTQRIQYQ